MKKKLPFLALIATVLTSSLLVSCNQTPPPSLDKDWEYQDSIIDDKYRNFYEIYVRSFYDADGNGYGDLRGVGLKMKYIHDLGFNGIWLMPIHPSISYHKYDVDDYYAIDEEYIVNTADEDFAYLIEEANKYDIAVMMDLVINHSSANHPWFKEAVSGLSQTVCAVPDSEGRPSAECLAAHPKIDYYNFYYQGKVPLDNTYRKVASLPNWYYEAGFSENMPDLNLNNESLKQEIVEIMRYWLNKGVKGFRLDAALHFFNKNENRNVSFLNWLNQQAKLVAPEGVDPYFVAEVWQGTSEQSYYKSGLDSFFNFSFSQGSGVTISAVTKNNAQYFVNKVVEYAEECQKYSDTAIVANFLGNHDMQRSANAALKTTENSDGTASRWIDVDYVKMCLALNQMITGASYTYYGEEIGMLGAAQGGDPSYRTAMLWSDDEYEICKNPPGSSVRDQDYGEGLRPGNVKEQLADANSILNFLKLATRLRYKYPAIARGEQEAIIYGDASTYAMLSKKYNDETIYLLINLYDQAYKMKLADEHRTLSIDYTLATNGLNSRQKGQEIEMQPLSITILK